MSTYIDHRLVTDPAAAEALNVVFKNPKAFGLTPKAIKFHRVAYQDIYFTSEQVLQVLNPLNPQQKNIDRDDLVFRCNQKTVPFSKKQFVGLANELQTKFAPLLRANQVRVDTRLFQPVEVSSHLLREATVLPQPVVKTSVNSSVTQAESQRVVTKVQAYHPVARVKVHRVVTQVQVHRVVTYASSYRMQSAFYLDAYLLMFAKNFENYLSKGERRFDVYISHPGFRRLIYDLSQRFKENYSDLHLDLKVTLGRPPMKEIRDGDWFNFRRILILGEKPDTVRYREAWLEAFSKNFATYLAKGDRHFDIFVKDPLLRQWVQEVTQQFKNSDQGLNLDIKLKSSPSKSDIEDAKWSHLKNDRRILVVGEFGLEEFFFNHGR